MESLQCDDIGFGCPIMFSAFNLYILNVEIDLVYVNI